MDGFEAFEHLFIGQDPLAIARHVRVARDDRLPRRPLLAARGRAVGHRRPGRRAARSRRCSAARVDGIPAYASCGMLLPAGERAESALRLRDEGFRALKIRVDPRAARGRARGGRRDPRRRRRHDGDHGRPEPGLADGRRHAPVARPDRRPPDRRPARRARRAVGRGAARRHRPARAGRRCGRPGSGSGSPAAR